MTKAIPAAPAPLAAPVAGAVVAPANVGEVRENKLPKLEGWRQSGARLIGQVFNDERFEDGSDIWTTEVVAGDLEPGKTVTTRTGTVYLLGEHA